MKRFFLLAFLIPTLATAAPPLSVTPPGGLSSLSPVDGLKPEMWGDYYRQVLTSLERVKQAYGQRFNLHLTPLTPEETECLKSKLAYGYIDMLLGTGLRSDLASGHRQALSYLQKKIDRFCNDKNGPGGKNRGVDVFNYFMNPSPAGVGYNRDGAPMTPELDAVWKVLGSKTFWTHYFAMEKHLPGTMSWKADQLWTLFTDPARASPESRKAAIIFASMVGAGWIGAGGVLPLSAEQAVMAAPLLPAPKDN